MLIAPHPHRVPLPVAALLVCTLLLAGCAGSATTRLPAPTVTPLATATSAPTVTLPPAPTATATPSLQPLNVPAGWQVYNGPHFAIAYPPNWSVGVFPQGNSTSAQPIVVYGFKSPDGGQTVSVTEADGFQATLKSQCLSFKSSALYSVVTLAGIPMFFTDKTAGGIVREWSFFTDQGTSYGLSAEDGRSSAAIRAQDDAVLSTFHAEFTSSVC